MQNEESKDGLNRRVFLSGVAAMAVPARVAASKQSEGDEKLAISGGAPVRAKRLETEYPGTQFELSRFAAGALQQHFGLSRGCLTTEIRDSIDTRMVKRSSLLQSRTRATRSESINPRIATVVPNQRAA